MTRTSKAARAFRSDEMRIAYKSALRAGWKPRIAGSGHIILTSPEGSRVVLSTTANGGRASQNAIAQLRRAGLEI